MMSPPLMKSRVSDERGVALLLVLMVMMLMSGLMIGFYAAVMADQRSSGVDRDQTQVYSVAHAGLEKLTADLANLFGANFAPTGTQVQALTGNPPVMSGFSYVAPDGTSGYKITYTADGSGNPAPADANGTTITSGPYQGFQGIITPYDITVTARSTGAAEVRMRRTLQTIAVPVFQFGVFSENDLSFFAGPNFSFGGRVHTNADLYLAEGGTNTLTLADRVTAVGEVIRSNLSNGLPATSGYTGIVRAIRSTGVYRNLAITEGSLAGGRGSAQNEPTWTNLSVGTYNSNLRNSRTGARRLDLPLVSQGARPVDIIRRPVPGEATSAPAVLDQRFFKQASLRILLSDAAADITGLPGIVTATPPTSLDTALSYGPGGKQAPLAASGGPVLDLNYKTPAGTPLIGGWIKIEKQNTAGVWSDVTQELLDLGITGRNLSNGTANAVFTGTNGNATTNACLPNDTQPDAVIRLQRVKDVPSTSSNAGSQYACAVTPGGVPSATASDYWPMALYDSREGLTRDNMATTSGAMNLGGVVYYIELDVKNLARWFLGTIGTTGNQSKTANGYIVYFSDRRNNRSPIATDCTPIPPAVVGVAPCETGEYGFEDVVNGGVANGVPNATLDAGEDVNASGTLQTYGATSQNVALGSTTPLDLTAGPMTTTGLTREVARGNRAILFRRALKLTNGGGTNLRTQPITGLTIASENPVYVQGDYNVGTAANYATEVHIACAVLADAITMLSNNWNDIRSFNSPNAPGSRPGTTTSYRMAIIAGKGVTFAKPAWASSTNSERDFGTDGGAHNFLRYLEGWSGTLSYRGSIVSFYTSRQGVGTYKCCNNIYGPPTRGYSFDTEFLVPSKLPPGTPMFRDINTLTFRQLLRPNQ